MKQLPSLCLVILDGFGYKKTKDDNPITPESMPFWHHLLKNYPHTLLSSSGPAVGSPEGTQGNSEVGHRTIGAGRVIPSLLTRINDDISSRAFFKKSSLTASFKGISDTKNALHLVGLISDGNVHSSLEHAIALAKAAHENEIETIYLHAILDGRDVAPHSAQKYLETILNATKDYGLQLASLQGRFYAMDRDDNKERTKTSYKIIYGPSKNSINDYKKYLTAEYEQGYSDEFVRPARFTNIPAPRENDLIFFFNIRPERTRQITKMFVDTKKNTRLKLMGLVDYGTGIPSLYKETDQGNSFLTIAHAAQPDRKYAVFAESEKAAHVTYYLGNLVIEPFVQTFIVSSKKKSPADDPIMQAETITRNALECIEKNPEYLAIINYANADMVGHTGNFHASVEALKCLDDQLKKLYELVVENQNNVLVITADHGNIEEKSPTDTTHRSHTTNPVPLLIASKEKIALPSEEASGLSCVAPLLLKLLGIKN